MLNVFSKFVPGLRWPGVVGSGVERQVERNHEQM